MLCDLYLNISSYLVLILHLEDLETCKSRTLGSLCIVSALWCYCSPCWLCRLKTVLFCQPSEPASGLLKMFDEDQMFSYNFNDRSTSPWMKQFDKWSGEAFPNPSDIALHAGLCSRYLQNFTEAVEGVMPENRGGTHVSVFTAHPLSMGATNTLICLINDVYPPALTITWRKNAEVLSRDLDSYGYFALGDLTFQAISYLNVTPHYNDVFSCDVQVAGDNRTIVAYWVPDYPVPSDLLENAVCGLGFALGIVFLLVGSVFLYLAWKLRNTD
ncbi:class II histocompatibility antigen, M alpha chain isoform X2 [Mixophyes fleayi]|uniref:class II histocompatibility antigen, M alpha chain isoform X2 n=1 Tax=Mixophyes fleayi TaxID=3061075 RepID=UPI003F4DA273